MGTRVFILDPVKSGSGRSRFFRDLAGILLDLGNSIAFVYPGKHIPERVYPLPPGTTDWPLVPTKEASSPIVGKLRWGVHSGAWVQERDLAQIMFRKGDILIVPATVNSTIVKKLKEGSSPVPKVVLTDHSGGRLVGTLTDDEIRNYKLLIGQADVVHTVAPQLAGIATECGAGRVFVIPNAVDGAAYIWTSLLLDAARKGRKKAIAAPGRLENRKGFEDLIKAFSIIHEEFNEYQLHIFGDGPEKQGLIDRAQDLGMQDHICFLGFDHDLIVKLRCYPIVAMATRYEAGPLILQESMASGCIPVFPKSAVGPANLIVDRRTGYLTNSHAADDMAMGIGTAIEVYERNPLQRVRMQLSIRVAAQSWSRRRIAREWSRLMAQLGT